MSGEGLSAKDVVNGYDYQSLARIIFEYGEEKFSRSIASKIIKYREQKPIETTMELAEIIKSAVPQKARREKNPCKKAVYVRLIFLSAYAEERLGEGL